MATSEKRCVYRNYNQLDVEMALESVRSGKLSQRQASNKYNVPRSTILDKLKGKSPVVTSPGQQPYLTPAEEARIMIWAREMGRIGYCQMKKYARQAVKKICDGQGRQTPFTNNLPGDNWWKLFSHRHAHLSVKLISKQTSNLEPGEIGPWFAELEKYMATREASGALFDGGRIFSCDENDFILDEVKAVEKEKVYTSVSAKGKRKRKASLEVAAAATEIHPLTRAQRPRTTVMTIVSAEGAYLPPMVLVPGPKVTLDIREGLPIGTHFIASETGTNEADNFFSYLRNTFLPFLHRKAVQFPVLLFVNGLKSHLSVEVSELCRANDIVLFCLPQQSDYLLNPCDVAVVKPLKIAWQNRESSYQKEHPEMPVTVLNFGKVFGEMLKGVASSPAVVRVAFKAAGLFPFTKVCGVENLESASQVDHGRVRPRLLNGVERVEQMTPHSPPPPSHTPAYPFPVPPQNSLPYAPQSLPSYPSTATPYQVVLRFEPPPPDSKKKKRRQGNSALTGEAIISYPDLPKRKSLGKKKNVTCKPKRNPAAHTQTALAQKELKRLQKAISGVYASVQKLQVGLPSPKYPPRKPTKRKLSVALKPKTPRKQGKHEIVRIEPLKVVYTATLDDITTSVETPTETPEVADSVHTEAGKNSTTTRPSEEEGPGALDATMNSESSEVVTGEEQAIASKDVEKTSDNVEEERVNRAEDVSDSNDLLMLEVVTVEDVTLLTEKESQAVK